MRHAAHAGHLPAIHFELPKELPASRAERRPALRAVPTTLWIQT